MKKRKNMKKIFGLLAFVLLALNMKTAVYAAEDDSLQNRYFFNNSDEEIIFVDEYAKTDKIEEEIIYKSSNREFLTADGYKYTLQFNGTAEITGYTKAAAELVIPAQVDGKTVTRIGDGAFMNCSSLVSVKIPEGVTSIGANAFYGCKNLINIEIPSSVSYMSSGIFWYCDKLETIIVAIGNPVYDSREGCNAIIRTEDNRLMAGCKGTWIPESVTNIEENAFFASGLIHIEIPRSITSIGAGAFGNCNSLETITVARANSVYDSRENCNAIIRKKNKSLIAGCKNTIIPTDVERIGEKAFFGCISLKNIVIPKSVAIIGNQAFEGCMQLEGIVIPESVTSVGTGVFGVCDALKTIVVESNNPVYDSRGNCNAIVRKEDNCLIAGCKNTIIPQSVTNIGTRAFQYCWITGITIPEGVTSIGAGAFYRCYQLKSIRIPRSVTSIASGAFAYCTDLRGAEIAGDVENIAGSVFEGCMELTVYCQENSNVHTYAMENNIKYQFGRMPENLTGDISASGLAQAGDGNWYLYENGAVNTAYTGLYCDASVGWWLVRNGQVDFGYTGLWNDPNYGWWLIGGGRVCFEYTGLWNDPNCGWWLIGGGSVCFDYTGLWNDPNCGWWLIGGGNVCFGYTGLWNDPNCGWWYVEGGSINFGYTGQVYYEGMPYNVINGQLV